MSKVLSKLSAAGTALTNSTTHTAMASYTFPGGAFAQAGKIYSARGCVRTTATNSTDTFQGRLYLSTATLAGDLLVDSTAVNATDNDLFNFDVTIEVRSVTRETSGLLSAVVIVHGIGSVLGVEGTATPRVIFASVAVADVTVARLLEVSGVWSVASASNSAQVEAFTITEIA